MSLSIDFGCILKKINPMVYKDLVRHVDFRQFPQEFMLISAILLYSSEDPETKYKKLNVIMKSLKQGNCGVINSLFFYNMIKFEIEKIGKIKLPEIINETLLKDTLKTNIYLLNLALKDFDLKNLQPIYLNHIDILFPNSNFFNINNSSMINFHFM